MIVADFGRRETRYRMLSTLRDFAADRLGDDAMAGELRARHARFSCDLAEAAEPGLRTAAEAHWVRQITADLGNLRTAHLWAIDHADTDVDARLLVALWNYGLQRLSAEYFRWVEEALDTLSFDDHPLAGWVRPALTTIAVPRYELGAKAVEVLLAEHRLPDPTVHRVPMPRRDRSSIASPRPADR